jgi:hypothetical protein
MVLRFFAPEGSEARHYRKDRGNDARAESAHIPFVCWEASMSALTSSAPEIRGPDEFHPCCGIFLLPVLPVAHDNA